MLLLETELHEVLKERLGKNIQFFYRNKVRKGIFFNFTQKNSFIVIKIQNDKGIHSYEIPFMTKFVVHENSIVFDYRLLSFADGDVDFMKELKDYSKTFKVNNAQFFDTLFRIEFWT